jgi:hypothetical protein
MTGNETFTDLLAKASLEVYRALEHQDFTRILTQMPEFMRGSSFNWVSGQPDELAGLPTQSVRDQLAREIVVKPFADAKFQMSVKKRDDAGVCDNSEIDTNSIALSMLVYEAEDGFSATLYSKERFLPFMQQFAQDLRLSTQQFVLDPKACVATNFNSD